MLTRNSKFSFFCIETHRSGAVDHKPLPTKSYIKKPQNLSTKASHRRASQRFDQLEKETSRPVPADLIESLGLEERFLGYFADYRGSEDFLGLGCLSSPQRLLTEKNLEHEQAQRAIETSFDADRLRKSCGLGISEDERPTDARRGKSRQIRHPRRR